jgi:hypothetical protein
MSYCGAIPVESDSHILVDTALARVRRDARLDEDPVLPPLDVILGKAPKRIVFSPDVISRVRERRLPKVETEITDDDLIEVDVEESEAPRALDAARVELRAPATPLVPMLLPDRPTAALPATLSRRPRTLAQRMRWPVLLCGFVAGVFAGAAVMKSPVGKKPAVQHAVKKVRTGLGSAWGGAVAAKTRLVSP